MNIAIILPRNMSFNAQSATSIDLCVRDFILSSRYRQSPAAADLTQFDDAGSHIVFDQPQWAVTPGQYAVVYDGERCLGGGVILSTTGAHTTKSPV